MGRPVVDRSGVQYGGLTALSPTARKEHTSVIWKCRCACGSIVYVSGSRLHNGTAKSCGCSSRPFHGHCPRDKPSKTYNSWSTMIQRTTNSKAANYKRYGGAGRGVCLRWRLPNGVGFRNFLADMGERPKGTTLERVKNHLGYSPSNCRWADSDTQQNNKKSSRFLTYKRRTQTVAQWAREVDINVQTIHKRLRSGWSVARTLSTPVDERKRSNV